MEEPGYTQCPRGHAVFRVGTWKNGDWAVCTFWVDDETGVGARHQSQRCSAESTVFRIGAPHWVLEIGVKRNSGTHTISPSQNAYIGHLIEISGQCHTPIHNFTRPRPILTNTGPKHAWEMEDKANNRYHELVGLLQCVSFARRPDVAFVVSKHSQFLANRGRVHLKTAIRALRPERNQGVTPQSRRR